MNPGRRGPVADDPPAAGVHPGATGSSSKEETSMRPLLTVGLVAMGHLAEVAIRVVAANLQTILGIHVDILEPLEVPRESFLTQRQQYDAGLILRHLAQSALPCHLRILGITAIDLCVPILTYVYGEAEVGGRVAVVSDFRLRQTDDGFPASLDRYYERLAKVARARSGTYLRSSSLRRSWMPDAFRGDTQAVGSGQAVVL